MTRCSLMTRSPVEIIPEDYLSTLDLEACFGRSAPLEVDLGCGEGSFLLDRATRHPERNFLGVERLLGRVRNVCTRARHRHLENVRVLRLETSYTVHYLLPRRSVSVFHVLFPDPWPKRRHHRRRLIHPPFLEAAASALLENGELRIKTDHEDYFGHIRRVTGNHPGLIETRWEDDDLLTDFETVFLARGLPIYRLRLLKT